MTKCPGCPVTRGECIGGVFCRRMREAPEQWRAAVISHAEQARANKPRVPLGTPHCVPCQQAAKK